MAKTQTLVGGSKPAGILPDSLNHTYVRKTAFEFRTRSHRGIVEDLRVATVRVATSELPNLEEWIPVDVLQNVLDRNAEDLLVAQELRHHRKVLWIAPVDLRHASQVRIHNFTLNTICVSIDEADATRAVKPLPLVLQTICVHSLENSCCVPFFLASDSIKRTPGVLLSFQLRHSDNIILHESFRLGCEET